MSLSALTVAASLIAGGSNCPLAAHGETAADCPWAAFNRRLVAEAEQGRSPDALLAKLAPQITAQLDRDAKQPAWLALWTESVNEAADGAPLVHPAILDAMRARLKLPAAADGVVHAGLLNTYGLLFSDQKLDDAFPRARWLSGELERGLGVKAGLFGPIPGAGTFLGNVTYVLARLVLDDVEDVLKKRTDVPAELRGLDYSALKSRRLEERVRVPHITGREIILRTDAVALPQSDALLVVYSWYDPSFGSARLLSAFPASAGTVDALFRSDRLGEEKVINSDYFSFIEGLTDSPEPLLGSRRLVSR